MEDSEMKTGVLLNTGVGNSGVAPAVSEIPAAPTEVAVPLTKGQYRVGINFNPSNNLAVDVIKATAAAFIDSIDMIDSTSKGSARGEVERLKNLAMTHVEDAAMWAVKAATKEPQ